MATMSARPMDIEVRGARKCFGRVEALRGVDLTIQGGDRIAIVGPNGSGKSTLIRALLGLIACEGVVLIDGRSPYVDRLALTRRLAYVPQVAPQLGASVAQILRMVSLTRNLDGRFIDEVARGFSIDLRQIERQPFRHLSGGMKQKLLIAIALASRPMLMVLDEPTASLDLHARRHFFELCRGLPETTTLVLCSHRLEELGALVERVVAIENGLAAFVGSVDAYRTVADLASPFPSESTGSESTGNEPKDAAEKETLP